MSDIPSEPAGGGPDRSALPVWFPWSVAVLCVLPLLLSLVGVDFGSPPPDPSAVGVDAMHDSLAGAFTHSLLEWSAFCAAVVTAILAFIHFGFSRDAMIPIVGAAIMCAGCLEAFHTLASARLVSGAAAPAELASFTWTAGRAFEAVVVAAGVAVVLVGRPGRRDGTRYVLWTTALFAALTGLVIHLSATTDRLPQTVYPGSSMPRPWDLLPLVLFAGVAGPLFLLLHRRRPSAFTHALLISLVPEIAAQAHMTFGSSSLLDGPANAAHLIKILSYVVPLVGLVIDLARSLDAHARSEEALREMEERLELAVKGTSDGLWDWNPQTNEVWYAPRFKELLGYRDDELPDTLEAFNEHLHPDDYRETWQAVEAHLRRGERFDVEYRLRTRQGAYRWFRARAMAVRGEDGRPIRMAGSIQDITDRKEAIEQLESLSKRLAQANTEFAVDARVDPLTRLLNRRAWEEAASIEDERSQRHERPYSVVMVDIDHFKKFNDAAGHLAGDECLVRVAGCIRDSCRMIDVVGRYGGEEFVVLLPETDAAGGEVLANRICEMVRDAAIPHPGLGPGSHVTVSVGVASGPHAEGWKKILDHADQALYQAKADGRDRVVVTTPTPKAA